MDETEVGRGDGRTDSGAGNPERQETGGRQVTAAQMTFD